MARGLASWEPVSWAYQYAFSTRSPSIFGCRHVSFGVPHAWGDLSDAVPGLSPLTAHLLYPLSRKLPAADCGLCFTSGNGARLGGLDYNGAASTVSRWRTFCAPIVSGTS